MATLTTVAVRDNSTLANFKQWAQIISNFMTTAGWTQSADTGQVNWSTIASVPTNTNYVYEIWEPNDSLTNFFLKIEYGTNNGTGIPSVRLSIGTSTNGAGSLSGLIAGPFFAPFVSGAAAVTSTSIQWNCYLSGAAGRLAVCMWNNETAAGGPMFFCVARSKNSSGASTSTHVSLITTGGSSNNNNWMPYSMQTIVFGNAATAAVTAASSPSPNPSMLPILATGFSSNSFASTDVPISLIIPMMQGYADNPLTEVGGVAAGDITDGATFVISAANMPYGVSHTYIGVKGSTAGTSNGLTCFGNFHCPNIAVVFLFE